MFLFLGFIDFIRNGNDVIELSNVKSASDTSSERIRTLLAGVSCSNFKFDAREEIYEILELSEKQIEVYSLEVSSRLTVKVPKDHDDISSFGGYERTSLTFNCGDFWETIKFVILSELLTRYQMENHNLSYSEASKVLYNGAWPTHHVTMILQVTF